MPDKKPKLIHVKVLAMFGKAMLVEWNDGKALHRATVPQYNPSDQISILDKEGFMGIDQEILEMGIPYGVPWQDVLKLSANLSDLVDRLHNAGIWTALDVQSHARELYGIIQAFYGIDVAAVITAANQYEEVRNNG